jgi:hypothetical protein
MLLDMHSVRDRGRSAVNSRYLVARFHEHMQKLVQTPGDHSIAPRTPVIGIYGTDEFRLDRKEGAVHLPEIGWVRCPGVVGCKCDPQWLGVIQTEDGYDVILGVGNPYASGTPAVPFALSRKMREMPGAPSMLEGAYPATATHGR